MGKPGVYDNLFSSSERLILQLFDIMEIRRKKDVGFAENDLLVPRRGNHRSQT